MNNIEIKEIGFSCFKFYSVLNGIPYAKIYEVIGYKKHHKTKKKIRSEIVVKLRGSYNQATMKVENLTHTIKCLTV